MRCKIVAYYAQRTVSGVHIDPVAAGFIRALPFPTNGTTPFDVAKVWEHMNKINNRMLTQPPLLTQYRASLLTEYADLQQASCGSVLDLNGPGGLSFSCTRLQEYDAMLYGRDANLVAGNPSPHFQLAKSGIAYGVGSDVSVDVSRSTMVYYLRWAYGSERGLLH
jgi:hypothetical protein